MNFIILCKDLTQDGLIRLGVKHGVQKAKVEIKERQQKKIKEKEKINKKKGNSVTSCVRI